MVHGSRCDAHSLDRLFRRCCGRRSGGDRSRGTARLKILSEVLAVSEAGLAYVFESLQSAGLIAREQPFDFAKIVDQRYLVQSRVLQDRGTVRR